MNRVYYSVRYILTKNIHKKNTNKIQYINNNNKIVRRFSTGNYTYYSNKPPNKFDFTVYIIAAGIYVYVMFGEPPTPTYN